MGKSKTLRFGLYMDLPIAFLTHGFTQFFVPSSIDSPLGLVMLVLVGICTGTVAGVLGIGGGMLIVPMLSLWQVALVQATATSMVGVMVSAMSGSWRNWQQGELRVKRSIALGLFGLPTAQVGAWVANQVSDRVLAFSMAGFLILTIYLVEWKKKLVHPQTSPLNPPMLGDFETRFSDRIPQNWGLGGAAPIGLLAGLLSGLFGVGGGAVMVPLQMVLLGEPIKSAVRTSLGAIALVSISALVRYGIQGNVLWLPGLALALGGMVGAQLGTRLLKRLPSDRVNQLFRGLLVMLAIYMTWRGFRGR